MLVYQKVLEWDSMANNCWRASHHVFRPAVLVVIIALCFGALETAIGLFRQMVHATATMRRNVEMRKQIERS